MTALATLAEEEIDTHTRQGPTCQLNPILQELASTAS